MGKSTIIAILFDGNRENIFFSGQTVSGKVHVQTTAAIKLRVIRLKVHGCSLVRWTEGSGEDKETYTGEEELVKLRFDLMGSRRYNSEIILQPGTRDLPFTFILSSNLPSSFEHKIGHVRYKAKAVIDRPLRIDDTAEVDFTVVRSLDLNREPLQFREPAVLQILFPVDGCCCVSGEPEIDITLNKRLFTVGEAIVAQGEISNRTNARIMHSTIALMQDIQFCATHRNGKIDRKERNRRNVLAKLRRPEIAPGRSDSWNNVVFVIPPVPTSRLDGCDIINISYHVEVEVVFNACCNFCLARADIVIGNIPLSSDFHSSVITSQPQPSVMPSALPIGYPTPINSAEKNVM